MISSQTDKINILDEINTFRTLKQAPKGRVQKQAEMQCLSISHPTASIPHPPHQIPASHILMHLRGIWKHGLICKAEIELQM